jgi:hypothetical protein
MASFITMVKNLIRFVFSTKKIYKMHRQPCLKRRDNKP